MTDSQTSKHKLVANLVEALTIAVDEMKKARPRIQGSKTLHFDMTYAIDNAEAYLREWRELPPVETSDCKAFVAPFPEGICENCNCPHYEHR